MTVFHSEFATDAPDLAEDLIRQAYTDQQMTITGVPADFEFVHRAVGVTEPCSMSINRWRNSMSLRFLAHPIDEVFVIEAVHRGTKTVYDNPAFDDAAAGPGHVLLGPTAGGFGSQSHNADTTLCVLERTQVAQHAAARTGIAPESLRFTALTPLTPALGRAWAATVAHVRDDVFAEPEIAENPILLRSSFQVLATTLLATFPNTAHDAANAPDAPAPGYVSDTAARRVLEHLHEHASEPLGPADVAALASAPARDVDDALRRRRNTTLAEQLWRARMQGAYRDLHDGDTAAGDTVAAIAARWGFTNPATFTAAYTLSTGGETPEHTLRR